MLVGICSDKGAPGTTTSALAIASAWHSPAIVVEADVAGGDLGIRLRPSGNALPETPTVLSLAAAARSDKEPTLVERHAHTLSSQVSVVAGALSAEQMTRVGDWGAAADALRRSDFPVIADLGQLHSSSATLPIASAADVVVVVGRPDVTSLVRMRDRIGQLGVHLGAQRGVPPSLYAVLVSSARHGQGHVQDLGALLSETRAKPFLAGAGYLAFDERAVRRLESGDEPKFRLARTALMRSARGVAADLHAVMGELDVAEPVSSAGEGAS